MRLLFSNNSLGTSPDPWYLLHDPDTLTATDTAVCRKGRNETHEH